MLPPLWFFLVLVRLYADWLSRSPADPALTLPPIAFNKLTQAPGSTSPCLSGKLESLSRIALQGTNAKNSGQVCALAVFHS